MRWQYSTGLRAPPKFVLNYVSCHHQSAIHNVTLMPRTRELSGPQKKLGSGKSYKTVAKCFGLQQSTVNGENGIPLFFPVFKVIIILTQAILALPDTSVHDPTRREILHNRITSCFRG